MDLRSRISAAIESRTAADEPGSVEINDRSLAWQERKEVVRALIVDQLAAEINGLSDAEKRAAVRSAVDGALARHDVLVSPRDQQAFVSELMSDILGYGPLDQLLSDQRITEIMCNAHDQIWVERDGVIDRAPLAFANADQYRRVIDRLARDVGRRIDESSPMVDARMRDGGRINAVIPPLAIDAPALTIRKASREPLTATDLMTLGNWTPDVVLFLEACVRHRVSILVSGGTGSGKTTALGALCRFIPSRERIVVIEDAAELRCDQPNKVSLEARPANAENVGMVTIRDLVRNALRMRPDRIIVGECRGGEALDMLQAMNTGHEGSLTTLHANSARDALARLETLVLLAGIDLPIRAIREQIASAIRLVVHLERLPSGQRILRSVSEVRGLEGERFTMVDVFTAGAEADGRAPLRPTGLRPAVVEVLAERGTELPATMFRSR